MIRPIEPSIRAQPPHGGHLVQRSRALPGAFGLLVAAPLLFGLLLASVPHAVLAAEYDVEVDACALLDDADIESLTEWTDFTTGSEDSSPSLSSCFWGSVRGGEPGYVELVVLRQSGLDAYYAYDDDCVETPVSGVGEQAAFVQCPSEVSLYAYAQGAVVSLLVDQPAEPLTADGLGGVVQSVFAQLGTLPSGEEPVSSASPPGAWSSEGSSTYEGTWTVVEYAFDGEGFEQDYELGDSVPGTIVVDCTSSDGFCSLEGTFDGELAVAVSLVVVSEGVARYENRDELANCDGGQTLTRTLDVEFGAEAATASDAFVYDPRTCDDEGGTLFNTDITWSFAGSLTAYTAPAGAAPSAGASASPGAEAPTPVEPVDEGPAVGNASDPPFHAAVPAPAAVSTDPVVLLQSAALAALLVFLMPFPSQLFNSTLETHEDEVRRWFRLDRLGGVAGGIGAFWASWPGVTLFTVLAAVLYGFLDPGFGFDVGSLATFLGLLLGIVLVTVAFAIPLVLAHRRHGERPSLKVVPVSLLIGVACVLLSRLTSFQPGYLYGLLIGLAFARELSAAEEGRATAIGALLMLGVACVAWIGLGVIPDGDDFGRVVGRTALAALMVAGLEGVVFGLLPMRFLPGEPLYRWNRVLWAALLLVGAFAFFHILINPASGYLSDTSRTPLFTVAALLLGFSLVSVAFWAWFRFRPAGPPAAESTD